MIMKVLNDNISASLCIQIVSRNKALAKADLIESFIFIWRLCQLLWHVAMNVTQHRWPQFLIWRVRGLQGVSGYRKCSQLVGNISKVGCGNWRLTALSLFYDVSTANVI